MEPLYAAKRRRPASASPPPSAEPLRRKKRRLQDTDSVDSPASPSSTPTSPTPAAASPKEPTSPTPAAANPTEPTPEPTPERTPRAAKRKRDELQTPLEAQKKRRADKANVSPPPELPATPPRASQESPHASQDDFRASQEEKSSSPRLSQEEKSRFPPPPVEIPKRQDEHLSKENREEELARACAYLEQGCRTPSKETEDAQVRQRVSLRSVQVTPPPSARMLDHKNPPPPPQRPKRRVRGGIVYARAYPRLPLSPLVDSPPSSPRVFRSLENEFAFAMQDTPEIRPRVRPAPRMARGTRRSTRAGSSRTRRSLDTPTSTMVLRSRQLNPSLSADSGKPENQREREQRDAQRRQ